MALKTLLMLTTVVAVAQAAHAGEDPWRSQILLECPHGLGGAAIGDLDSDTPGNEVAAVSAAGEVWLVRRTGSDWQPERIFECDGELIMCAIGDIDPAHQGNEFVGVGMVSGEESLAGPGQVLMLHRDHDQWQATRIFEDEHMIHGVAIGDVSARHGGREIVVCGFNHRVTLLYLEQGHWRHETIYVGNDRMKIVAAADILPEHTGLEVLACGSDGSVVALWEGRLGWHHETIFSDSIGQSRVASGEPGVLIGGDKGKVTLARQHGGQWAAEFVARDTGKIRGVAIADVDDAAPGAELYACGYSRNVLQLVQSEGSLWSARVIFTAKRPLHHLVAGEIDPTHPGPELVTCGHGGRVIALFLDD